jgi:O-antigen/teichoic acid export membrane protein
MVLARLLSKEEMGLMGLTAIFFTAAGTLAASGFGSALIRKQNRTAEDADTLFWFNLGMGLLIALLFFCTAPWLADFFEAAPLCNLVRASALIVLLNSAVNVHMAHYMGRRQFKVPALICLGSALVAMPLCLLLAWQGWGVWAYMAQGIVSALLSALLFWFICPWKPCWQFSMPSFRELAPLGCRLAATGLLDTAYIHARAFFIGKVYTPAALAGYKNGAQLAAMCPTVLCYMIEQVTFPILSSLQHSPQKLLGVYRRYMRFFTLPIAWLCCFTAAFAEPIIKLSYGPGWEECVPYLQILSLSYATWHLQLINLNLLKAGGPEKLFLRLELIKKCLGIGILIGMFFISVEAICWGALGTSVLCLGVNTWATSRYMNLPARQQLLDWLPLFAIASLSSGMGTLLPIPANAPLLQLSSGLIASLALYLTSLRILTPTSLKDATRLMRSLIH